MSKELVLGADKALSFLDNIKVLEALGKTAGKAAELAAALHVASIWEVLEAFAKDPNSVAIKTAFDQVNLSEEYRILKVSLPKLVDQLGKCKALLKPLNASPIGSDDGKFSWSVSKTAQPVVKADSYSLNLGATATLEMDCGAAWDGVAPPQRLLRLGADGKLTADGAAKLPFSIGAVSASAAASAELKLDYFFKADETEIYAVAAAECIAHLQDPFDLGAVFARMQTSNLEGLIYEFDSAASTEVKVSLAEALTLADGKVSVNVGADVAVTAKLQTKHVLSLHKIAGPPFAMGVKLTRNPVETAGFSASLGIDVDISKLVQPVLDAMKKAATEWDKELGTIKPFLSPGTWLQDQAKALIAAKVGEIVADPAFRAALINDLDMAIGAADATEEGLKKVLGDLIGGAIDRNSALVGSSVEDGAKRVVDTLTAAVPSLRSAVGVQALAKVNDLVSKALEQADDALKTEVGKLLTKFGDELGAVLTRVGATITGAVNTIDGALKNVRDLLAKVDDNFKKILKSVETALKQKISAKFYLSESSTTGIVVEIGGRVTAAGPGSRAIFDALMGRNLQPLIDMVGTGKPGPANFVLDPAASKVTRFSKHHSESGVEVLLLGIDLKSTVVADANATSIVDGFGNVYVNTDTNLKKTFSSSWSTREASFVETSALVFAGNLQKVGKPPVLELGVNASYMDKKLDWNDVDGFTKRLADTNLISAGAGPAAKMTIDGWGKAAGGVGKIEGSIAAALRLNGSQTTTLLGKEKYNNPGSTSASLTPVARRAIVAKALAVLRAEKTIDVKQFSRGCVLAHDQSIVGNPVVSAADPEPDIVLNYRTAIPGNRQPPPDAPPTSQNTPAQYVGGTQDDYVYFFVQALKLLRLADLVETMGAVYHSTATAGTGWTEDDYQRAQDHMVRYCGAWVQVANSVESLFKPDITPWTLAFMRTLADLCGPVGEPSVQLTLTYKPKASETKLATFV